jgi:phosphatidate cytidylyltransferase
MNAATGGANPSSKSGGFGDLGPRLASAAVLAVAAAVTAAIGGLAFVFFWLGAAFAVEWEWQGLIGGERRLPRVAIGGAALAAAAGVAAGADIQPASIVLLALAGVVGLLAGPERRLWAFVGVVYGGALILSAQSLRLSQSHGALAIAWLFALVWGTDVFAYFGGRLIGGPKLWPRVSAGKTWSGTITGVLGGALAGLGVAYLGAEGKNWAIPVFFASLVAACLAQIGDLFESSVKRRFGVKDSSNLIPGHGGVMDRVDGFIFAALFAAIFGAFRNPASPAAGLFLW